MEATGKWIRLTPEEIRESNRLRAVKERDRLENGGEDDSKERRRALLRSPYKQANNPPPAEEVPVVDEEDEDGGLSFRNSPEETE